MGVRFAWIPESPKISGVYAVEVDPFSGATNCTRNLFEALKFGSKEECEIWCATHPKPPFVPREHGLMESPQ
jgi:hypothetical protein